MPAPYLYERLVVSDFVVPSPAEAPSGCARKNPKYWDDMEAVGKTGRLNVGERLAPATENEWNAWDRAPTFCDFVSAAIKGGHCQR